MSRDGSNGKSSKTTGKKQPGDQEPDLIDRQPPFNLDAERWVLGSIALMPELIDDLVPIIRAEDFYDIAHQHVFSCCVALHESGKKKFDITLAIEWLQNHGLYESVGGSAFLFKIVNGVPHPAHGMYYAEIVRDTAVKRRLIESTTEILRRAFDSREDVRELADSAESSIFSVTESLAAAGGEAADIKEVLHAAIDRVIARQTHQHSGGISTSILGWDQMTGGLHASELTIVAARPGMGKTAVVTAIGMALAKASLPDAQRKKTLFFSLEMPELELADRMLSQVSGVSLWRMRNGMITNQDRDELVGASSNVAAASLWIRDEPKVSATQIAAHCRRHKRKSGLDLVIIDYLQLLEVEQRRDETRATAVGRVTRRLKLLARELEIPVVCLAQLNRSNEMGAIREPRLSDLRESGEIEQDADNVIFVHRPAYYDKSLKEIKPGSEKRDKNGNIIPGTGEIDNSKGEECKLIISKQRNGPCGDVPVLFFPDRALFTNPVLSSHNMSQVPGGAQEYDPDPQLPIPEVF